MRSGALDVPGFNSSGLLANECIKLKINSYLVGMIIPFSLPLKVIRVVLSFVRLSFKHVRVNC